MVKAAATRPRYEKPSDLENERKVAAEIARRWTCEVKKNPDRYGLDYGCYRNRIGVAFAEIKRRHRTFNQYPDCFISLSKVMHARSIAATSGLPCYFVVQFDDELAWADLCIDGRQVTFDGRTDRGDWQDEEPIVRIPMNDFYKVRAK